MQFPLDDELIYSTEMHCWQFNGESISDEEAEPIYQQKMAGRLESEQSGSSKQKREGE